MRRTEIDLLIEARSLFNQVELAKEIGVSRRTIIRWLNKQAKPIGEHRKKIREFLGRHRFDVSEIDGLKRIRPMGIESKQIRESLGLSVAEFASKLGVHIMTVYGWESGKRKPSPLAQEKIGRAGIFMDRELFRKLRKMITPQEQIWLVNLSEDYNEYRVKLKQLADKYIHKTIDFEIKHGEKYE